MARVSRRYTTKHFTTHGSAVESATKAELRVYMMEPEKMHMHRFDEALEAAIADTLVMVPFVSLQALSSYAGQKSWVQREIDYRKSLFDPNHCNILPIELEGGMTAEFADGFSSIRIRPSGMHDDAIDQVIQQIKNVRNGEKEPPYATTHYPQN